MKIPFDIKYRPQIESGDYAVFTDCGEPAEIVKWDCKGNCPILAVIDDGDTHDCCFFKSDGLSFSEKESLYIVTPEPEYTEFEKKVAEILFDRQDEDDWVMCLKLGKEYAKELLNIAKREFNETACSVSTALEATLSDWLSSDTEGKLSSETMRVVSIRRAKELRELTRKHLCSICKEHSDGYREGWENATRYLPRWQIFKGLGMAIADDYVLVKFNDGYKLLQRGDRIEAGTEFLPVTQLEKLPKEESK